MVHVLSRSLPSTIIRLTIVGLLIAISEQEERFFTKVTTAPSLNLADILSSHKVHSEVECAYYCLSENRCVGFKYKSAKNWESVNCQLSNSTKSKNINAANYIYNNEGWHFFICAPDISVKQNIEQLENDINDHHISTAGPSPFPQHEKCSGYAWLNESNRNLNTGSATNCDSGLSGWYRFGGAAGTIMATSCVSQHQCGTHAPGWMNGAHPTIADGKVTRTVCYHYFSSCCQWSNNIELVNCGQYYVYKLLSTPPEHPCNLRYCGSDD